MSRRRPAAVPDPGHTASSSSSLDDEGDLHDSQDYGSSHHEGEEIWDDDDYDEIDPSDSASASQELHPPRPQSARPTRTDSRRHRIPPQRQSFTSYRVPAPPMSVEPSDEFFAPRYGHGPPPAGPGPFYGARGPAPQPGYPQSHVGGGFMPPNHYGNGQMVPYNYPQNPFTPMSGNGGADFFTGPPRGHYDMQMQYGGHHGGNGFFNPQGGYGVPPHMQQYMYGNAPPPPPTEVGAPPKAPTPGPERKDPVVEQMKAELELYKKEQAKKDAAEKQRDLEEKIRRDTELAYQRRMEEMRRAQEEAKKEIEKAKAEAERAARERMEAERKADEERRKLQEEAMRRAERDARDKLEKELKAMEERKKREAEAAVAAEAAARAKIEAAMKAAAEAKAEAEKKAKEEEEWRKTLELEAKLKAENAAREKLAKEAKEAEAAKAAAEEQKKAEEAFKKKALEEAKAKAEEAAKKNEKAPIKFKDAVGRKFSFPFHLCQTWPGMEELIKQAFLHVDVIGPHVQEGHYDLIGPNGEIILPSVWEKVIEPDWAVTMHMWPMDKAPLRAGHPGGMPPQGMPMRPGVHPGHPSAFRPGAFPQGMRPMGVRPGGGGGGVPPPPPGWAGRAHAPPGGEGRGRPHPHIIEAEPRKKSTPKSGSGGVLGWISGSKPAKSSSKKKKPT